MDNSKFIQNGTSVLEDFQLAEEHCPTLPPAEIEAQKLLGVICPNCGAHLEGRKCKLFCPRRGCGYLVTCSEW